MTIPEEWRWRAPAMTERGWRGLSRILQHVDAPRYNRTIGDRVGEQQLGALADFRQLTLKAPLESEREPSDAMSSSIEALRGRLSLLDDLPFGFDAARDFVELPTTTREDIVLALEKLVPRDVDLDDAIVYSTSGTTGHPVVVPSHPGAMVKNLAHLELLAALYGVRLDPEEGAPWMLNVSAQQRTYVFATCMSGWNGAVFAKINLATHDWAGGAAARHRFTADFDPRLVASEPATMAEMMRVELPIRPHLMVSSAVALASDHAARVAEVFGSAVVDLYSSTETGPIAATLPGVAGHVVLLPDVYVEALDERGDRVKDGELGEITVTGGRNPYLPLVRYRTGDHGRLATVTLADGRRARAILDLAGRAPVTYRSADGSPITSVDIARVIRPIGAFVQHAFVQRANGAIELSLRPIPNVPIPLESMEHALVELFGPRARVAVRVDEELGREGGKVVAWRSELAEARS